MSFQELRNYERELYQFRLRLAVAGFAVVAAFGLLGARFLFLQVVQHDVYASKAEDNRISIVPIPPNRGLILDRNGIVIARNYSGYTLEIFPRRVKSVERTIGELSELIEITPRDRARFRKVMVETRNPESVPIRTRLSDEEVARFAVNRFRYEGAKVLRASIDPEHKIAIDVDPSNNEWLDDERPAHRAAAKWAARYLFWLQNLLELHTLVG